MALSRTDRRNRLRFRIRKTVSGNEQRPRLAVFRSNKDIYAQLIDAGVKNISFDRGGYLYHGRVKSLADGAREAGLKF